MKSYRYIQAGVLVIAVVMTIATYARPFSAGYGPLSATLPYYRFSVGAIFKDGAINIRFLRRPIQAANAPSDIVDVPIPYDRRYQEEPYYKNNFPISSYSLPWAVIERVDAVGHLSTTKRFRPVYRFSIVNLPFWTIAGAICIGVSIYRRRRIIALSNKCKHCHYDLRGSLDSAVCPKCGTAISAEQKEKIRAMLSLEEPAQQSQ